MEEIKNETKEQENSNVKLLEKTEKTNELDNKIEKEEKKEDSKTEEEMKIKILEEAKKEENAIIEKQNKKIKIGPIIIITVILIVIIAIFSTIFAVINIGNSKIMKGISIGQIDVSNMSKEDAQKALNEIYLGKSENEIYLTYENLEAVVTYKALEVEYKIDDAIQEAYDIGRKGNIFVDNIDILKTWIYGINIEVEPILDIDMISEMSQNINNNLKGAVVQSSYYEEDGKLIVTSGKSGVKVDEEKLQDKLYEVINENTEAEQKIEIPVVTVNPDKIDIEKIHSEVYKEVQNAYYTQNPFTIIPESDGKDFDVENAKILLAEEKEEYEIPLNITKPTKTVKDIGTEAFPDKLGTCSTKYLASNVNRTTNLRLAAQKINGTILLPGEEFSYNKTVGERTIQAGYKEAAVYSNGEVVNGLGGGICQISSTLYDAVVVANLNVTTRRNHQFVTSYLPAGKDATVVWGSQDFKFVNTRQYPIRIEATVNGGVATVSIWGVKEEVEYEISIETKKTATIAYTTQYIEDPSLPAGTEVVKQAGSNGRKVEAYKVVKLNGQVVSTTLLSKDTYNAMKRIVRVGTAGQ